MLAYGLFVTLYFSREKLSLMVLNGDLARFNIR
jgi:hypothetical protein